MKVTGSRQRAISAALVVVLTLMGSAGTASASISADERGFLDLSNADRSANGLAALTWDPAASDIAREWSQSMASRNTLAHNPNLASQVNSRVTTAWTRLGENVGVGYSVSSLHNAFMNSPGHRANVLGGYNRVGIGTVRTGDGRLWVTLVFIQGPPIANSLQPASAPSGAAWYLRSSLSTGVADLTLSYGMASDRPVFCDWNGDGIDTEGIYRDGVFHLRNSLSSGVADLTVGYGMSGDLPVCGDWDGNGTDTVGVYRNGVYYLRNTNTTGGADIVAGYGMGGDKPVVGDWDGNGTDTPGIFRNGVFHLRNTSTTGGADVVVGYGMGGDFPLAGDWDGNGTDTPGVQRQGAFYVRNTNSTGVADVSFVYGNPSDIPVSGDWNGDGKSSISIVRAV